MGPKIKYSTSKISPAKLNKATGKTLVKTHKLPKSQQKTREICHIYEMKLRSGLIIRKETCYFEKESIKKYPQKSCKKHERDRSAAVKNKQPGVIGLKGASSKEGARRLDIESIKGISPVTQSHASLSTFNDQSVSFKVLKDGRYVINVEDSGKLQENDKMLLRYYESTESSSESGDGVDGKLLMVDMSPAKDTDIRLHANKQNHCVKLEKCQAPLPPAVFFVVHQKTSDYVSFECKNQPGTYIGVKDNQLALLEGEKNDDENIMFKLSK
ncbi:interleukin-33 [Arvicola amphibius]|uniref:interleukin-33 n=1 Tax=Arvicola amphibius TaxID=1047088 RepID=UPI0018E2ED77|nr:interleukin-33 [Arvicola amphibius]XP_038185129.1 interleukin-33 [Arvicola amphibius]